VTVKVAMSLDGKTATRTGESFPLTGTEARTRVHVLRDRVDAIVVGRRTAERDDPQLTCRLPAELAGPGGPRDPLRIVLDPRLILSDSLKIFRLHRDGQSATPTLVVAATDTLGHQDHLAKLDALGVEVIRSPRLDDGRLDLAHLLGELARRDIGSILVEGGGTTIAHLMEARLVDAWIAHVAPVLVGGADAPTPFDGVGVERLEDRFALGHLEVRSLGRDVELVASVEGDVYGLD
jgi:diaminohydroxyphosphoribosylaminopyrimidine deaminase/5-amino-6-(5-phosphoribosylamino)uracil reductase